MKYEEMDGACYRCFVEEDRESTNKIVTHDIDTSLMEQLFDPTIGDKQDVEARLPATIFAAVSTKERSRMEEGNGFSTRTRWRGTSRSCWTLMRGRSEIAFRMPEKTAFR